MRKRNMFIVYLYQLKELPIKKNYTQFRRPSIRPDSTKAGKIIKERQSLDVIQKVKCSAEKLDRQGILLSVDGYTTFKEYVALFILIDIFSLEQTRNPFEYL